MGLGDSRLQAPDKGATGREEPGTAMLPGTGGGEQGGKPGHSRRPSQELHPHNYQGRTVLTLQMWTQKPREVQPFAQGSRTRWKKVLNLGLQNPKSQRRGVCVCV